ncbi:MAG TPA: hypothetical protein VHO90_16610 [Bacteroidales bacterium]|nr:hypothetical protein [Bacteroidales bacterium]
MLKKQIHLTLCVWILFLYSGSIRAQSNLYFTDGYHGGIYGHYPPGYTGFLVDKLEQNPFWKINLEIEPETWDTVRLRDAAGYARWKKILQEPAFQDRIEFVNPAYAQPYGFNISGESLIRQFQYGMRKINEHFPQVRFSTYSSEEPCFTSCLPGLLKSLGFSNAVLKNPNTCWGGYFRAHGGELLHWVGSDGTSMLTSPRYSCESLLPGSTWQTIAWNLSKEYVDACIKAGIATPVGMCYQDAGWKNGPWLGDNSKADRSFEYVLWRDYFSTRPNAEGAPHWTYSQEDVLPGLVWGAQVLQQLSQQVRVSENKLVQSEKIAAINSYLDGKGYPTKNFDDAWRTLMLSQHHDCWIVPYNGKPGYTWAHDVKRWTAFTNRVCDSIVASSGPVRSSDNSKELLIKVFNTTAEQRKSVVSFLLPSGWESNDITVINVKGKPCLSQVVENGGKKYVLFLADIPAIGFSSFKILKKDPPLG